MELFLKRSFCWREEKLISQLHAISKWYIFDCGPGQLSRYSDSLRAGRSGDRIPVEARFSAPVQTGPGAHPASCTMGTGSLPGVKRPGRGANPYPHLQCRGLKKGRAIHLPTLRALVAYKGGTFYRLLKSTQTIYRMKTVIFSNRYHVELQIAEQLLHLYSVQRHEFDRTRVMIALFFSSIEIVPQNIGVLVFHITLLIQLQIKL